MSEKEATTESKKEMILGGEVTKLQKKERSGEEGKEKNLLTAVHSAIVQIFKFDLLEIIRKLY